MNRPLLASTRVKFPYAPSEAYQQQMIRNARIMGWTLHKVKKPTGTLEVTYTFWKYARRQSKQTG